MNELDKEVMLFVEKWGFAPVIAALARWAYRPTEQQHPQRKMGTAFRRLNSIYEYLTDK